VNGQIVQGLSYNISAPAFSRSMTGMSKPVDFFQLSPGGIESPAMLAGQYSDQSSVSLGITANLVKGSYWAQGRFADRKIDIDRSIGRENFRAAMIKAQIEAEQSFYDVIQKQIRLRIAERALETARKLAADLKEMVEVGESDKIALLRSQQQIALAEIDLNAAATEYSDSREKLRELLSMKSEEFAGVYPDAYEILKLPARPVMSVEQAVTEGLTNRPDLKVQDLSLEKQTIDTRVGSLGRLPNLDLSVNYAKSTTDQGFGQTTDEALKHGSRAMSLSLSTSYQIIGNTDFDSFRQAKIALEKARLNREKTQNQVSKEITSAMERLRIAYIRLEHAKSNRQISEDKVAAEYEKFIVGESDNKNLIDAQTEVTQSRIAELQAYIEVRNTTSSLNQALGKGGES
jgi:outer membrane protein TolC